MIFVLYSVAFGHNFLFDEENIILRNPLIRSLSLVPQLFTHGYFFFEGRPVTDWAQYYRPLTSLTFALDYQFWKLNPLGYNLTNTFLHCLVSVLFFLILLKMIRNTTAAFLAALLFSVHTLHTEAVTYIASRGDLLGAALILGALYCYWGRYAKMSLFFYALALFAKESAILLPLYLLALNVCFMKSPRKVLIRDLIPFVCVAALFFIFRKFYCPIPLGPPSNDLREAALRVLSMGDPFLSYLQAIFLPETFKFCQSVQFAPSFLNPRVLKTLFVALLLLAGWFLAWRRRGAAFFGMSLFLLSFLPYIQVVHFYPEWAEHYLYIPSIGLAILLGCFIREILYAKNKPVIVLFFVLYFVFFLFVCQRTWARNAAYNDTFKYYQRLAQSDSPYAFFGYQNLARLAIEQGDWDDAIVPLKTAEAIEPHSDVTQNLLGLYYLQKNRTTEAVQHFRTASWLNKGDNTYLMNAGIALIRRGQYEDAIKILEEVQKKSPAHLSVYTNLIAAYDLWGQPKKALAWADGGLKAFEGKESETVVLTMATARLAFRQGWQELLKEKLAVILQKYPDAFWYGDVARLFSGKTTPDEFLQIVQKKYPGFKSTAQINVLIALDLREQWGKIDAVMEANKTKFEKQAKNHPLIKKELDLVRAKAQKNRATGV